MRNIKLFVIVIASIIITASCKKDETHSTDTNLVNVNNFLAKQAPSLQSFTINASTGGVLTTTQGTTITIPENAFLSQTNTPISGNVTIEFKDIYKKSDMIFCDKQTLFENCQTLKSGGEFYIKAVQNNIALKIAPNKKIDISLPIANNDRDTGMKAMNLFIKAMPYWKVSTTDSLKVQAANYIYSLYQFKSPADSGTWCNSDNPNYFSAYNQTKVTFHPTDLSKFYNYQELYLVFKNVKAMVHIYRNGFMTQGPKDEFDYEYYYAPVGQECTLVAVAIKDGKIYSSFTPFTISDNQKINFTMSETTTEDFIAKVKSLD